MNARQRRKARRAEGIRPPCRCLWCHCAEAPAAGRCPQCGEKVLPIGEYGLRDLYRKALRKGFRINAEFFKANPLEELADAADAAGNTDPRPVVA